jgi:enamine deaminase RidA (YjgF/YER057c/UK114 family)
MEKRQINPWSWVSAELMPGPAPASTALQVSALAPPGVIEVDAVAVV